MDDPKLPSVVKEIAKQEESLFLFHQVSLWEVQIKYDLGKLPLHKHPGDFLVQACLQSGLEKADLQDEAIFFLSKIPPIHRDPFDRLLVAHAILNGWEMATSDSVLERYPIRILK